MARLGETDLGCEQVRLELSARLDGESDPRLAEAVELHLRGCPSCRSHGSRLEQVRATLRLGEAERVPDLTSEIRARLQAQELGVRARSRLQARARIASVAALAACLAFVALAHPWRGPELAQAKEIARQVQAAARELTSYHASFSISETGWSARVPRRHFSAELWFQAPEKLRLTIRDLTPYPSPEGWPHNNIDLIAGARRSWMREPSGCPVQTLPQCTPLPEERSLVHRPPFNGETMLPTDIILPLQTLAETAGVKVLGEEEVAGKNTYRIALPYRQAQPLIASLQPGGEWRPFHPKDRVEVWLEEATWFPLRVVVKAAQGMERADWASLEGLRKEAPGSVLFSVRARSFSEPTRFPPGTFAAPISGTIQEGGFEPQPPSSSAPLPSFTSGLRPYLSGRAGRTELVTYWRGLSWLNLGIEPSRHELPSLRAEELKLPQGWAYYLPASPGQARRLDLYSPRFHLLLESNLKRAQLLEIAASIPVVTERAPQILREGGLVVRRVDEDAFSVATEVRRQGVSSDFALHPGWLPQGYRARVATLSKAHGKRTLTVYYRRAEAEFDGTGIRLTQFPAATLPPTSEKLMAVEVRGELGHWSPERGELDWVEDGVYRAIAVPSLGLETALRIARGLE